MSGNPWFAVNIHNVTQGGQLISRLHSPIWTKMRARRIFEFGEKCESVAAPDLDRVAAWRRPRTNSGFVAEALSSRGLARMAHSRGSHPGAHAAVGGQVLLLAKMQDPGQKRVAQERSALAVLLKARTSAKSSALLRLSIFRWPKIYMKFQEFH